MSNPPPSSTRRVRLAHESKSATVRAAAAAPSRRMMSHWQREQRHQQLLYVAVGALVGIIVLIFAGGLIYDNVIRANQVVAQVGPDSITASQLLNEVRPQARALDAQAKQYGGGSNIAQYVNQQKRSMPDQVLNELIDDTLIRQEAARRGISVAPSDVDDKERQTVASFNQANSATPTPEASITPEAASTADAVGAAAAAAAAAATSAPTAAPTPDLSTPTAVPTLDDDAYGPALQKLLDQNNLTEPELRTQLERGLLRDKVSTALGQEQVPDTQAQVHARQIVVAAPDVASSLLTQLQGGADFATLAQQNSTDTATKTGGGDMGWFGKGVQTKAIDDAVFALQPGQLSDVIQDTAGYHILQVLESDPNRAVPAAQLTSQRSKAFNDWLSSQRSGQDVKLSLDPSESNWILSKIGIRP